MNELRTFGGYVDRCVEHALTVLQPVAADVDLVVDDDIEVHLFRQSWPDTACGWPGIAGQAFTSAYTVVVLGPCSDAVVYLGRPAYYLPPAEARGQQTRPGPSSAKRDKFYAALNARTMPRVADCGSVGCRRF